MAGAMKAGIIGDAIPEEWLAVLQRREWIMEMCGDTKDK